jgi:hypothetical protein
MVSGSGEEEFTSRILSVISRQDGIDVGFMDGGGSKGAEGGGSDVVEKDDISIPAESSPMTVLQARLERIKTRMEDTTRERDTISLKDNSKDTIIIGSPNELGGARKWVCGRTPAYPFSGILSIFVKY